MASYLVPTFILNANSPMFQENLSKMPTDEMVAHLG